MNEDEQPLSAQTIATLRTIARRDRRRAEEARALVARERERTLRLAAQVDALEAELAALRGSSAYRMTYPLRRLASALPASVYTSLRGRRVQPAGQNLAAQPEIGRPADTRAAALLVDDWFPEPDRDSGSVDIVNMASCLSQLGFAVSFGTRRDHESGSSKRKPLESLGVHTLGIRDAPDLEAFLRGRGPSLALVVLNRLYCGGALLETVRRCAPQARILFNTIDLHWIRLEREAAISGDESVRAASLQARQRELHLAREADATIVVSSVELEILRRDAPDAYAIELKLARTPAPPMATFAERGGVGFIGGFRHVPNTDAVTWFAHQVWPSVTRAIPACRFSVVGPDLPEGLLDDVPGRIERLGHVPDVGPWFESLRLTVAPLRFGAGAKGKVVSSLAAGVPCVATAIALEGMGLHPGDGVLSAETAEAMARTIVMLHEDPGLWQPLSTAALETVRRRFSLDEWREKLAEMLEILDVLPSAFSDGGAS